MAQMHIYLEVNLYHWITSILTGVLWCVIMRLLGGIVYNIGIRRYEAYGS